MRIVEPGALTNLESQYLDSSRVINPALDHAFVHCNYFKTSRPIHKDKKYPW